MTEWHQVVLGACAGVLMGAFFFGGLWLTVRWITAPCRRPMLTVFASLLIRGAVVALCFYALARWVGWIAILVALVAMILVRVVLSRAARTDAAGEELCLERIS